MNRAGKAYFYSSAQSTVPYAAYIAPTTSSICNGYRLNTLVSVGIFPDPKYFSVLPLHIQLVLSCQM